MVSPMYSVGFSMLIIVLGSGSSSLIGYGQNATNSTAMTVGNATYDGTNFTFQYPSSMHIERTIDPIGEIALIANPQTRELIIVSMGQDPSVPTNLTQEEMDSNLEQIFPQFVKTFISRIQLGTLTELQSPIYDKYVIDGHRAGAANFTTTDGQTTNENLFIGTVVGDDGFAVAYAAPADIFNQNLPLIENIIKSVDVKE